MLLSDRRLKFARNLIEHWLDIRRGALVPRDEDLDPRELVRCFRDIGIADLTQPAQLVFELAGDGVSRRFDRDLRHVDWLDLVPAVLGDAGERARSQICGVPCGYYHKITAARDDAAAIVAETLVLPLRRRLDMIPAAVIGITRDFDGSGVSPPPGWLHRSTRIQHYLHELVDIGAGATKKA
jgi:hypothetical protein